MNRPGEIDWLMDELVSHVQQIRHAVVLSRDGLPDRPDGPTAG